jgi:large subunit ribosomal protein L18
LINDEKNCIILTASDKDTKKSKVENKEEKIAGKIASAYKIGESIAQKALKNKIEKVVFDRGGYKYHGRVKALAEGARKGGLKF